MITIALDETSGFEEHDTMTGPVYIAGIIYDDGGSGTDLENETDRLMTYFKWACESVGCEYPRDMHAGNLTNNRNVAMSKEAVKQGLAEFLQKGTFHGRVLSGESGELPERTGKYYLCLILKSAAGKNDLLGDSVNVLVKDDFAGNLYVHMAEEAISRCIFHNPLIADVKQVSFDLATRRIVLQGEDKNRRAEEYIRLRYPEVPARERVARDSREFVIVNPDVYRTAIEREMTLSDRMDIKIDRFSIRSISYRDNAGKDMVFLHLADVICSALSYKIAGDCPKEWLEILDAKMSGFIGQEGYLLFAYDTVDSYYADAWKLYEDKDYYRALCVAYDGMEYESDCSEYYRKVWFPRLLAGLQKETDYMAYTMAVHKFSEAVYGGRLNQDKMCFVLRGLEQMAENIDFPNPEDGAVLYRFYGTAAKVFNLCGLSEQAERYAEKGRQFAGFMGVEELLRIRNEAVVAKCDQFNFVIAEKEAIENLNLYDRIREVRDVLTGENEGSWVARARALSQLGQIFAFTRKPEAETYFLRAMSELGEGTKNYHIALSYLMHFYLDNGLREKYEECALRYFGVGELDLQLSVLLKLGEEAQDDPASMKYGLYLYVRAIWKFYMEEISEELSEELCNLMGVLKRIVSDEGWLEGHPWQHIFKYLAMIAHRRGRGVAAKAYQEAIAAILEGCDDIVKVMVHFGNAEIADMKRDTVTRNGEARKAWAEILEISEEISAQDCTNPMKLYDYLNEIITYTYR